MSISSKKSGYTLLFAVLVSVLVLGVAVFISGIARKQYILSSTALDSMYSFYAADSGIECVAYAPNSGIGSSTDPTPLTCGGQTITPGSGSYVTVSTPSFITNNAGGSVSEYSFNLGFGSSSGGCAKVVIDDYKDASGGNNEVVTSYGYNLCTPSFGPDTTSPRTVERALQLHYYQ